jgi:hypothetical protein
MPVDRRSPSPPPRRYRNRDALFTSTNAIPLGPSRMSTRSPHHTSDASDSRTPTRQQSSGEVTPRQDNNTSSSRRWNNDSSTPLIKVESSSRAVSPFTGGQGSSSSNRGGASTSNSGPSSSSFRLTIPTGPRNKNLHIPSTFGLSRTTTQSISPIALRASFDKEEAYFRREPPAPPPEPTPPQPQQEQRDPRPSYNRSASRRLLDLSLTPELDTEVSLAVSWLPHCSY